MKSFVISLPHAKERRAHINTVFTDAKIPFEFFDAIHQQNLKACATTLGIDINKSVLTFSELGCLLSHASIWQWMVEHHLSYAAIFEDDVILGKHAHYFLSCDTWIPKHCDIVKLEVFHPHRSMSLKPHKLKHGRYLRKLLESHVGMAGYIMSLTSAQWALEKLRNTHPLIPIDHLLFNDWLINSDKNMYQMTPALCLQSDRIELILGSKHTLNLPKGSQQLLSQIETERLQRSQFNKPCKVHSPKPKHFSAKLIKETLRPYRQAKKALMNATSTINFS